MTDNQDLMMHLEGLTPKELSLFSYYNKMSKEDSSEAERKSFKDAANKIGNKNEKSD